MVSRSFAAFDNEAFVVASGSPSGTPGTPIINNSSTPVGTIFEFNAGFPYQTITLDDTSSTPDIFNDDDEDNHTITNGGTLVANGTGVESESYHYLRALNHFGQPVGPRITVTVFSQNGQTSNIWGMAADTQLTPGVQDVKVGGSNNGNSLYDNFVPCFTAGTQIATQTGARGIETLQVGDRVVTRDNGMQEVRWVGSCTLSALDLSKDPAKRPVSIRRDAFGPGLPDRDLMFSPQHRVLLLDAETTLHFAEPEVLAAAKDLVGRSGVTRVKPDSVTYVHVLFDAHETLMSDGLWSESFLPGAYSLGSLDRAQQREIFGLFPDLQSEQGLAAFAPSRRILKRHEATAIN